jgi:hypothetical protein
MKLPANLTLVGSIDKYHADSNELPRTHMGASILGHDCDRYLWLHFRWAVIEKFPGRVRRLFRRGHNEEATIVDDLRAVGVDIRATGDSQARLNFGCHIGGSVDGIIEKGLPESPHKRHIAEFKTHSKKSFDDLERHGVQKSKPMHWAQMQLYMLGTKIDRAAYIAVCKDDDRLYVERVRYEQKAAQALLERGKRITLADRMPEPISADPSWYKCKFCPAHDQCFGSKLTKQVNCRTCVHSTAREDGTWHCERWDDAIPEEAQRTGCDSHVLHPDLVPWPIANQSSGWEGSYLIDDKPVRNGEADAYTFSSHELIANPSACAWGDENITAMRQTFGARIVPSPPPEEPF